MYDLPAVVDFNFHVKPILSDRCFACHGPDKNQRKANLRLDTPAGLFEQRLESGGVAFRPKRIGQSEALQRIHSTDPDLVMPPPESNLTMTDREVAILEKWVRQGAPYEEHWAYIKPEKGNLPKVHQKDWPQNPIDYFVLNRLEEEGLSPSPPADKETLLRRVSFDLTGLPPTVEAMDAFLADTSSDAYEKAVDRLLSSPAHGERLAAEWLDIARYADTHGYTVDRYRDMSPWRDWVIHAFNQNMPFDQFVTWQLAGDLLPDPNREQLIATAFNRNHAQNAEGGIVNEEFRVEYVADRTETFGTAFLGMTMNCARCHDHKYDPIEQREFYSLFSFFNNVDESGQITWSNYDTPAPTLLLTDEEVQNQLNFIQREAAEVETELAGLEQELEPAFSHWLEKAGQIRWSDHPRGLVAHFSLENNRKERLSNLVDARRPGRLIDPVTNRIPVNEVETVDGYQGRGIRLNGDDGLDFPDVGAFDRAHPFSVGIWVKIPEALRSGVIFHSNKGGIIYNFKGYQVSVEVDRLDVRLAHAFPYNSIHLVSEEKVPKGEWMHLMLTYDGSSDASGVRLYRNGAAVPMTVKRNNLYKDIIFRRDGVKTNLRVGARWRSKGLNDGTVDEVMVFDRELTPLEVEWVALDNPLPDMLQAGTEISPKDRPFLFEFWRANYTKDYQRLKKQLEDKRRTYAEAVEAVPELMIIQEMPEPRPAFILERGQYDAHGERVYPATPERILPFPEDYPENRLGLARWLFHEDHPLTARVTVNRYWQLYFGRGLVGTPEDFGNQGDLPTHPALLDWLAVHFRESGWDIRALQKLIVMSATYRQSSMVSPELQEVDPENKLLARGPRQRLSAEMLRDNALAASGLLVRKIGGPSVKPYQPPGLWRFNSGRYRQDHGDSLYRRSLYTFWKRTVPPPTMNTFDAPDRSYCVARRQKTSTPLQALTLLNDPQFVEAARVLAQRTMAEEAEERKRIVRIYRQLTGKKPKAEESALLTELYLRSLEKYKAETEKMTGLLATGEYPLPEDIDRAQLAALTVVGSTVMNYDACIVKR